MGLGCISSVFARRPGCIELKWNPERPGMFRVPAHLYFLIAVPNFPGSLWFGLTLKVRVFLPIYWLNPHYPPVIATSPHSLPLK